MVIRNTLDKMRDFATRAASGDVQALGDLRGEVVDLALIDLATKVAPKNLMIAYIAKKLLNDLWTNVGTDASFGFPEETDEEYALVEKFSRALGQLIEMGLASRSHEDDEILGLLTDSVISYYDIIRSIEERELRGKLKVAYYKSQLRGAT